MSILVSGATGKPMVLVATWPDGSRVFRVADQSAGIRHLVYFDERGGGFGMDMSEGGGLQATDSWPYARGERSARVIAKFRWLLQAIRPESPFPFALVFTYPTLEDDPEIVLLQAEIPAADDPEWAPLVSQADALVLESRRTCPVLAHRHLEQVPEVIELREILRGLFGLVRPEDPVFRLETEALRNARPTCPPGTSSFSAWAGLRVQNGSCKWEREGLPSEIFSELRSGAPLHLRGQKESFVLLHPDQVRGWREARSLLGELSAPEATSLCQMLGEPSPYLLSWDEVFAWASSQ